MRAGFQEALQGLQDQVLILASMADKAIDRAIAALKARDVELAQQVIDEDTLLDRRRTDIEERAIALIATQQPMASDLRAIVVILNIIVELERIGDYAEGIAKLAIRLADQPPLKQLIDIPRMAEKARSMLRRSIDAYVDRDADAARAIAAEDDEIDRLHEQVYRELLTYMIEDPRTITRATYLIWISHNLERIADRTTNICERVVYLVTGQMEDINAPRY
ncbi:MAG TPA: phosphate signaling complex protein PhoU [Chloroflexota bacterium]|nr:phosphate signaling complex protein PhoU [Chloroflexota bacterium]